MCVIRLADDKINRDKYLVEISKV